MNSWKFSTVRPSIPVCHFCVESCEESCIQACEGSVSCAFSLLFHIPCTSLTESCFQCRRTWIHAFKTLANCVLLTRSAPKPPKNSTFCAATFVKACVVESIKAPSSCKLRFAIHLSFYDTSFTALDMVSLMLCAEQFETRRPCV